jgi:hypothetical protein
VTIKAKLNHKAQNWTVGILVGRTLETIPVAVQP